MDIIASFHTYSSLFWFIAAIAIVTARFQELLILFFIVFVHELGHAVAASFFSWRIKAIVLLPFGGVAEFDEHGNRSLREEMWVVLAGPLQHVWMIILSYLLFSISIIPTSFHELFIKYNVMILLFNCLPILPLDGGKLVYLVYARLFPFLQALKWAIVSSVCFLILYCCLILIVFPLHLNAWFMAIFFLISLYKEWKNRPYIFMRFLLQRYTEGIGDSKKEHIISVSTQESLQKVVSQFKRGVRHSIYIYQSITPIGRLSDEEVLQAYFHRNEQIQTINDLLSA